MKTLAYLFNNYQSPVINIEEACRRKKKLPENWETRTYFDIVRLREMTAICRIDKQSSFSYVNSENNSGHQKGSKGIAHELVQQYICNLDKTWSFKTYGKTINILVKSVIDEYHVVSPETQKDYFIDCMIHLDENCKYYEVFNGKIGIEVTDKHKTSNTKTKAFNDLKLNVLELKTIDDWHIENKSEYSKEDIIRLRGRIKHFIQKVPYLSSLNLTTRI